MALPAIAQIGIGVSAEAAVRTDDDGFVVAYVRNPSVFDAHMPSHAHRLFVARTPSVALVRMPIVYASDARMLFGVRNAPPLGLVRMLSDARNRSDVCHSHHIHNRGASCIRQVC